EEAIAIAADGDAVAYGDVRSAGCQNRIKRGCVIDLHSLDRGLDRRIDPDAAAAAANDRVTHCNVEEGQNAIAVSKTVDDAILDVRLFAALSDVDAHLRESESVKRQSSDGHPPARSGVHGDCRAQAIESNRRINTWGSGDRGRSIDREWAITSR